MLQGNIKTAAMALELLSQPFVTKGASSLLKVHWTWTSQPDGQLGQMKA